MYLQVLLLKIHLVFGHLQFCMDYALSRINDTLSILTSTLASDEKNKSILH